MGISTNLSDTLDSIEGLDARYDRSVKVLLADKQILAHILKYTMEEFYHESVRDVIACIDDRGIEIGAAPVDPRLTKAKKAEQTESEENVPSEAQIRYDIRFRGRTKDKERCVVLINVEARKSSDAGSLGYRLENRVTYYLARMISFQKGTEFINSDYDSIKKVCSIWICMDSADDGDSIEKIGLVKETEFGRSSDMNFDLARGVIVRIRKNRSAEDSKNALIAMLEDLLSGDDVAAKKRNLTEKHGMDMTVDVEGKVNTMCNLSEVLREESEAKGIEKGVEKGIEKGIERGKALMLQDYIQQGLLSIADAAKGAKRSVEEFREDMAKMGYPV